MKILVVGDTHGDTSSICNVAIPKARKEGCKLIVQVGDFGYWEHQEQGKRFLNKVSKCLVKENLTMLWIDGNHENHPLLWEKYPAIQVGGYDSFYDGMSEIRDNLFYVPRGHAVKIGPANCLFVGGAYSIDKEWRIQDELIGGNPGTLWWDTETITDSDVGRAVRHAQTLGKIDLMFTHDCPTGVQIPGINDNLFPQARLNRDKLTSIFDKVQPRMLVHGHYHVRYTDRLSLHPRPRYLDEEGDGSGEYMLDWDYCRVDGLSCNGLHGFCVVLDLDSLFLLE